MRRIPRTPLPVAAQAYLDRRQASANVRHSQGSQNIEREWKTARQTKAVGKVLSTLQRMAGRRERCMYCVDSHGSDIEHFWPKVAFPREAFQWHNMLLCCTECGRFKGSSFPMANGRPQLIDPTTDDPWQHIDFDPVTGNLSARFDATVGDWSARGVETVSALQLDRREGMAAGYLRTHRRLAAAVRTGLVKLADASMTSVALIAALHDADDHGLLPWCLKGAGQPVSPFRDLCNRFPQVWADCLSTLQ